LSEEDNELFDQALQSLTPKEQQVILMYYFDKKTQVEIASELHISQPTVAQRLDRAIDKMRNLLQ
jgi:RNA polymerase sigma factor (sigma-70 family)